MIQVLLDTNAYLRLAKRIRPLLGRPFGQKDYVLIILPAVEEEVRRQPKLKFRNPWFSDPELVAERSASKIRLSFKEKETILSTRDFLLSHVASDALRFTEKGRSPPGITDCWLLAFAMTRSAIVVTDDLGMHLLAADFDIPVWHGYELLKKMHSAKIIDSALVREIYGALEVNGDLTQTWIDAKATTFAKILR